MSDALQTSPINTLLGVLLAGGESRRMGKDKAQIEVAGQPLWMRQINTLRQCQVNQVVVSARTQPSWLPSDVLCVIDRYNAGPMGGILSVLDQIQEAYGLFLAVDMPMMTADFLRKTIDSASHEQGVVWKSDRCVETMVILLPKKALESGYQQCSQQDYSLQNWVKIMEEQMILTVKKISPEDEIVFKNINTPEEWASLQTQV